jgi:RNA polymerase sigma factor (sigma-70 family)
MRDDFGNTAVQDWIDRLRGGDPSAREALLVCAGDRLLRIARRMLQSFPGVGRWEQSEDVTQNALLRLDRALRALTPDTPRDFFRLAAAQVRRELIDLARKYDGPEGLGAHHSTKVRDPGGDGGARNGRGRDPSQTTHDPHRLASWTEFHRRIEALGEDDRELFDLIWYQGLTQSQAAEVLGVSERTVCRRWIAARLKLDEALGGQTPV